MKKRTRKLIRYGVTPIAAGLIVGGIISQLTLDYLDHKLEQMVVDTPPSTNAGVIAAVSAIEKNATAPYQVIEVTAPPNCDVANQ